MSQPPVAKQWGRTEKNIRYNYKDYPEEHLYLFLPMKINFNLTGQERSTLFYILVLKMGILHFFRLQKGKKSMQTKEVIKSKQGCQWFLQ